MKELNYRRQWLLLLLLLFSSTTTCSFLLNAQRRAKRMTAPTHHPFSPPPYSSSSSSSGVPAAISGVGGGNAGEVERPLVMAMSKRSKRRLMARSRSSQWTRAGNGPTVDYLVVVDFEATCERGDKTYAHDHN